MVLVVAAFWGQLNMTFVQGFLGLSAPLQFLQSLTGLTLPFILKFRRTLSFLQDISNVCKVVQKAIVKFDRGESALPRRSLTFIKSNLLIYACARWKSQICAAYVPQMDTVKKGTTNFRDFAKKNVEGEAQVQFQKSLFNLLTQMGTVTLAEQLHVLARGDAYNSIHNGSQHQKDPVIGPLLKNWGFMTRYHVFNSNVETLTTRSLFQCDVTNMQSISVSL
jgi:hypothetical protein